VLRTTLFRLAVADGIYFLKKNQKGNPDIWEAFSEVLLKQPEFAGLEGSAHSICSQFKDTLDKRASHHGWTDANGGITGNLSGHEGDLDDLDRNVKQILMDREEKKAKKELEKIEKGELNDIEKDVLTSRLQSQAKAKRSRGPEQRKGGKGESPSSISSLSANSSSASSVDDLFSSIFGPSPSAKKSKPVIDDDLGEQLSSHFEAKRLRAQHVETEAGLSDEGAGILFIATMDIVFQVFCHPDHFCDLDYFQPKMISYGMCALDAHKLFMWIKNFHSKFRKEKEVVNTES
jgi:hypothetical protein